MAGPRCAHTVWRNVKYETDTVSMNRQISIVSRERASRTYSSEMSKQYIASRKRERESMRAIKLIWTRREYITYRLDIVVLSQFSAFFLLPLEGNSREPPRALISCCRAYLYAGSRFVVMEPEFMYESLILRARSTGERIPS